MNGKTTKSKNSHSRNSADHQRRTGTAQNGQMSPDERIVNRTNARRKRNRRKKNIIRAVICSVFIIIATVLVLFLFFNISQITVSGDGVYSEAEIIEASGIKIGDNLIFISSKKLNTKLTETLPYVGSVKIKRHLPATLEIIVAETTAEYAVITDGTYTLLDENGKVLEKGFSFVGENITIINLGNVTAADLGKIITLENSQIFDKFIELRGALAETGITGITSADLTNIYDIKLVYQGRITLILGETDGNSLVHKLSLAKEAIKTQDAENNAYRGTINLTVSGKAYWAEATEPAESTSEVPETVTDENGSVISEENTEANSENNSESISEENTTAVSEENSAESTSKAA